LTTGVVHPTVEFFMIEVQVFRDIARRPSRRPLRYEAVKDCVLGLWTKSTIECRGCISTLDGLPIQSQSLTFWAPYDSPTVDFVAAAGRRCGRNHRRREGAWRVLHDWSAGRCEWWPYSGKPESWFV